MIDAAGRLALVYAEAEAAQRRATLAEEALNLTVADARAALVLVEEGREPVLRGIQGARFPCLQAFTLEGIDLEASSFEDVARGRVGGRWRRQRRRRARLAARARPAAV